MAEFIMMLTPILWIILIASAVLLLLMPFFVLRIRNELIDLNRVHRRILTLLESAIPDSIKPHPASRTCANCRTVNPATATRCEHCGDKFSSAKVPTGEKSIITKQNGIPVKICGKCDQRNEPLAGKCRKCGAEI